MYGASSASGLVGPSGRLQRSGARLRHPDRDEPGTRRARRRSSRAATAASAWPRSSRAPLDDHRELDLRLGVERLGLRLLSQRERTLGSTEAAFAVGHDRQVLRRAVQPAHGAQLAQRLGVPARAVRGQTGGLAHDVDAAGAPDRSLGVLVRELGATSSSRPTITRWRPTPSALSLLSVRRRPRTERSRSLNTTSSGISGATTRSSCGGRVSRRSSVSRRSAPAPWLRLEPDRSSRPDPPDGGRRSPVAGRSARLPPAAGRDELVRSPEAAVHDLPTRDADRSTTAGRSTGAARSSRAHRTDGSPGSAGRRPSDGRRHSGARRRHGRRTTVARCHGCGRRRRTDGRRTDGRAAPRSRSPPYEGGLRSRSARPRTGHRTRAGRPRDDRHRTAGSRTTTCRRRTAGRRTRTAPHRERSPYGADGRPRRTVTTGRTVAVRRTIAGRPRAVAGADRHRRTVAVGGPYAGPVTTGPVTVRRTVATACTVPTDGRSP